MFEDLKNLAESVATTDLMEQISGGTSNECHDDPQYSPENPFPTVQPNYEED